MVARQRKSKSGSSCFLFLSACLMILCILTFLIIKLISYNNLNSKNIIQSYININALSPQTSVTLHNCTYHTCFDVYNCAYSIKGPIKVYIYPSIEYLDEEGNKISLNMSREFDDMLRSVKNSIYYTEDITRACLFIPPFDLLNQRNIDFELTSKLLNSLPRWNHGKNHLIFNMISSIKPNNVFPMNFNIDQAILASASFSLYTYRTYFDVSIPVFNPFFKDSEHSNKDRPVLLVSSQIDLVQDMQKKLSDLEGLLILGACPSMSFRQRCDSDGQVYHYPDVLKSATFCLVGRGRRLGEMVLGDCMQMGSIPVIAVDSYVMPFSEVLDWKSASIIVPEASLHEIVDLLLSIPSERLIAMQQQVAFFWNSYLKSMDHIVLTTLKIINDRVFPYAAKSRQSWNEAAHVLPNPLFLPMISPSSLGFTAVVLTYDRVDSLFKVISKLANVSSLAKILVIWNNQLKPPPPINVWPKINKPLQIIQTKENKLSNRFYPYKEIETEAVLALDDDILMLTIDELQFGFEVWREFQDRIVGFPSRLHIWNNATQSWLYESEWGSQISMVLTGAAFYHKFYNHLYSTSMPGDILSWVDTKVNCEDIAFNFLVANLTGKPSIKVTPRQKFRCRECSPLSSLSFDMDEHMVERSECINHFASVYGGMQLQAVEFRVDPVIFKDNNFGPSEMIRFKDIGNL